jgi:hypothetical protein
MTEQEWLTCSEPGSMIYFLMHDQTAMYRTRWQGWVGGRQWRTSERKLRLFACACCRRVAVRMPGSAALAVVEAAEAHADGRCDFSAVEQALALADRMEQARPRVLTVLAQVNEREHAGFQALRSLVNQDLESVITAVHFAFHAMRSSAIVTTDKGLFEGSAQASLLREIVGNPFCPPRLDPAWLAWNGGAVEHIARSIQETGSFEDMPILADALADAGCRDEAILGHCRNEATTHVPGCWLVDLLTGRE